MSLAVETEHRGNMSTLEMLVVVLNGEPATTRAATLAELVAEQNLAGLKVATAHNGAFVPERARTGTPLAAGDRIEIVSPRQGG